MNKDLNELGSGINIFISPIKKKESKIVQLHCLGFHMKELIRKTYLRLQVDRNTPIAFAYTFRHYYFDIGWYGLLNGTTLSFLSYFAVRMGATSSQLGFITAGPAVISLIFALPVGVILKRFPINRATFISASITRIFYLVLIFLPFIQNSALVIVLVILITIIMSIPAVFSTVGFNTAFAVNIPDEYRAHVAGVRNAAFAVVTIVVSLISGYILNHIPFPNGYVIVFAIGTIGAAASSVELFRLIPHAEKGSLEIAANASELPSRGWFADRIVEGFRSFRKQIRFELLRGKSGTPILLLTLITFALYISAPVIPVYLVNRFHFSDQVLSIGMACFNFTIFLGSLNLDRAERKMGRKRAIGLGFTLMSTFPAILIFMHEPLLYYAGNLISGIGSALVNGELFNYLYERIPANDHTSGIAWFTLSSNAAVLTGALLGPLIANQFGFIISMILFTILRFTVSMIVLRWG
jgi:MFS family permease